jgi:dolichol kinase
MDKNLHTSRKASRKFLHMMIGNFPFIIPFFTSNIYPVLVAAPFIFLTFFTSPYSPFKNISKRLKGLADITEEGHHLGLVFYAVSYTFLALFFASKPCVIAAGVLPMAYGDSAASMVGERYGRRRYKLVADKSLEGSAAMFFASFFSFTISLIFFSTLYSFSVFGKIFSALAVAAVATLVESFSPMGFDNLTVPAFGALTFLLLDGGI